MMTPDQFLRHVRSLESRFMSDIKNKMIPAAGKIAKEHFDKSFEDEGFTNLTYERWPARANNERPADPILVKTGKLKTSNRLRPITGGVQVYNPTPYGGYHNEGIGQRKRQFMGYSHELNTKIKGAIKVIALQTFSRL